MTKFTSAKFEKEKKKHPSYIILRIETKDIRANSVDPDEVAHYELPHLDLNCL